MIAHMPFLLLGEQIDKEGLSQMISLGFLLSQLK
jgi:hypothetical protein